MKRFYLILFILFLISGCQGKKQGSPVAIEIDKMKITAAEFEDAFNKSFFAKASGPSARKEFLDNFIIRKLILREAEREGLDKSPKFLQDVELFWQQSLLKLMLDRKARELSINLAVDDSEVKKYYDAHRDAEFSGKTLEEAYGQIKFLILQNKGTEALSGWTDSLREKSSVKIGQELLNIEAK